MAKRFTDNEKWKKTFFKSLSTVNKLFFLYILDDCDHAGIWHVEPEIASLRIGEKIDIQLAKEELGKHIYEFDNGEKWFIPFFIEFQYGSLNPSVNAHKSVIDRLKKRNLSEIYQQFINCSSRVMDKDMDKDKDKDKVKDKEEDKEKDTEEPKKLTEIKAYFTAKDYPLEEAISFFNHYEAQGWVTGSGVPIFNWKMKAENWHKEQRSRNLNKKTEQKSEITYSEILDIVDKTPKTEKSKVWDKYENIGKDKYRLKTTA